MERQRALAVSLGILAASLLLIDVGIVAPSVLPAVEWSKTYKGVQYTFARSAEQTSDGGYIITGYTAFGSLTGSLAWLLKTDPNGQTQWNRTYDQFGNTSAESVEQTTDGGYIFAGSQGPVFSHYPSFLVKTHPNGSMAWNRTYMAGAARYVRQTSDSGYIVLCQGAPEPNYGVNLLLKTDSVGDTQWNKTLRGEFFNVQQTQDGGYVLAGIAVRPGSDNASLVRTDSNGNVLWTSTYGGPNSYALSVQLTRDGGYIFATVTDYGYRSQRAWLVKVASNGSTLWSKGIGTGNMDSVYSVQLTRDGGYIILGWGARGGYWLTRMDSTGNPLWMMIFERQYTWQGVVPVFVQQTSDGGYVVAGGGSGSFWLSKLTEYPSPILVATYLGLALGTPFFTIAAVAVNERMQRPTRRRT